MGVQSIQPCTCDSESIVTWAAVERAVPLSPWWARFSSAFTNQIGCSSVVSTGSALFHPRFEICLYRLVA